MPRVVITFKIRRETVDAIDKLIEEGWFLTRSDVIRTAVVCFVLALEKYKKQYGHTPLSLETIRTKIVNILSMFLEDKKQCREKKWRK